MTTIETNWVLLDDTLEDADSVSSISSADDTSERVGSLNLRASDIDCFPDAVTDSFRGAYEKSDVFELQRTIRVLSIQNSRLKRLIRRDSDERASLNEVIECFMEWLVSSLASMGTAEEACGMSVKSSIEIVTSSLASQCMERRGGIAADFERLASVPLRAGSVVGTLFRPDLEMLQTSRRFRERSMWIKAL